MKTTILITLAMMLSACELGSPHACVATLAECDSFCAPHGLGVYALTRNGAYCSEPALLCECGGAR